MSEPITNLAAAMAAMGALPVPQGQQPRTLDQVEHELDGANLSLWEEQQENARLRLALASAQRGRRELRAQVAALLSERHTTNEALDDAVRALRDRQTPQAFVPQTERSRWVDIAAALNAAQDAGMPVGIDLDGTLTDHRAWSVVWDRAAERWEVAGYDDAVDVGLLVETHGREADA